MTLEIDILTLFPAMLEGPLDGEHPGPDPGARPGRDPGPRPARVGARAASLGRRPAVRRRRRDDHPARAGCRRAGARSAGPDSTVILLDPGGEPFRQARASDLAVARPPHPRLSALRGSRRADPGDGRSGAVDRRLRADRRRAAGARRGRCDPAPPARARSTPSRPSRSRSPTASSSIPQYTRPADFDGRGVPAILTSGDHAAVRRWRHREAIRRTLERRPDLLLERSWTPFERTLLDELRAEADERGRRLTGLRRGRLLYSAVGRP